LLEVACLETKPLYAIAAFAGMRWSEIDNSIGLARSAIPVAIPVARAVRCFSSIEKAKCAQVAKAS